MLAPGTLIDGRYEIVEFIGEGGMGIVYRARHKAMERAIALKLLKIGLIKDEDKVARFRNEARALSNLDHPNVISVHAVGVADTGQPYIAMDFVTGESLSSIIHERGFLEQSEALEICSQIASALEYAHSNKIIHRDVKPSNIIIQRTADGTRVAKLVDFGIAKILDPSSEAQKLTQTGVAIGSVFYLSPGMLEGRGAEPASDIYALGCTLYEMLTGTPPFPADTLLEAALKHKLEAPPTVNDKNPSAKIDASLQSVIDCMLQKEHHLRYQSAEELNADLNAVRQNQQPLVASKNRAAPDGAKPASLRAGPASNWLAYAGKAGAIDSRVIAVASFVITIIAAGVLLASPFSPLKSQSSDVVELVRNAVRDETISRDKPELTKELYPETVRATDAADTARRSVLQIRAWRMRGIMYVRIADATQDRTMRAQMLQQGLTWLHHAGRIGAEAVQNKTNVPMEDVPEVNLEAFGAQYDYIQNCILHDINPASEEWYALVTLFSRCKEQVSHNQREGLNSASWHALRLAIKNHDGPEFARSSLIRNSILKALGASTVDKSNELEDLIKELKGSIGQEYIDQARANFGN